MNRGLAILLAISPFICIAIGTMIGLIRYIKFGDEIRKRVEKDFAQKRERGGIHALYHKRPDKRVFYETFGIPMYIGLFAGLLVIFIIFQLL